MADFDLAAIPALFLWIKKNVSTFIFSSLMLLAVYAGYNFIGISAQIFGSKLATDRSELKKAIETFPELDKLLNKEVLQFNASRAVIERFHNSVHDVSHMSFYFASATNIAVQPGIAVNLAEITNLPMSYYATIMPDLMDNKSLILNIADMPNGPLHELFTKRGVKVAVLVPITNLTDDVIGFLALAWMNPNDVPQDKDLMIKKLKEDASRVSGYVSER